ncbi:hypothetical protein Bca4012_000803 [Brassica carinata]
MALFNFLIIPSPKQSEVFEPNPKRAKPPKYLKVISIVAHEDIWIYMTEKQPGTLAIKLNNNCRRKDQKIGLISSDESKYKIAQYNQIRSFGEIVITSITPLPSLQNITDKNQLRDSYQYNLGKEKGSENRLDSL